MPHSRTPSPVRTRAFFRTAAAVAAALLAVSTALVSAQAAIGAPLAGASAPGAVAREAAEPLYDFVELPDQQVAADGRAHTVAVHYRSTLPTARQAAVQILVEPVGTGAPLDPADVRLERLDPTTGRWQDVPLASQTGTLYTAIPSTGQVLQPGDSLDVLARITVAPAAAVPTGRVLIQPRIVLFRNA
jgi:hypothetical protein